LSVRIEVSRSGNVLATLAGKVEGSIIRDLVSDVGAYAEQNMKNGCPVKTGALKNSIQSFMVGDREVRVQPALEYGVYVERGSVAHVIRVRNKKALHWVEGGRDRFAVEVQHPSVAPTNFIRKAADETGADVAYLFGLAFKNVLGR
jgi:hypothetical protein